MRWNAFTLGFHCPNCSHSSNKLSLNSCLIRLKGFNNKNSTLSRVCSTWPSGTAVAWYTEGPEFASGRYFFSSLLFFSSFFFFFFSFSFHFRYNSFVMFLYIAHNFWLTNFLLRFTCRSPPPSPSRGPAIYVFLVLPSLNKVVHMYECSRFFRFDCKVMASAQFLANIIYAW